MTSEVESPTGVRRQPTSEDGEGPAQDRDAPAPGITAEHYAAGWQMALLAADAGKARSVQTDGGLLGASDFGGCTHKAVLTVRKTTPTDVPSKGKALIGTALHAAFLDQQHLLHPNLFVESELTATLPSGRQVPVHPDLLDPDEPSVTDAKFVSDLAYRRKVGVSDQQHMQRNIYGLAMIQAGLADPDRLIVRNIYVSMTDALDVWVQQEPFSWDWIERAEEWGGNVAYAVEHDEDGAKDAQPHFCESYCPFFSACKPPLLDAMGELTSPTLRQAVHEGFEARSMRKVYEKVEKQAGEVLKGVSGRAGNVSAISTWVNSGNGYWKTEYRTIGG